MFCSWHWLPDSEQALGWLRSRPEDLCVCVSVSVCVCVCVSVCLLCVCLGSSGNLVGEIMLCVCMCVCVYGSGNLIGAVTFLESGIHHDRCCCWYRGHLLRHKSERTQEENLQPLSEERAPLFASACHCSVTSYQFIHLLVDACIVYSICL